MTDTAIATRPVEPELTPYEVIEKVVGSGDLSRMQPEDRIAFYWRTCESLGLNPLTQPFRFLQLDGKVVMYATKDATDQLRRVNRVSITELRRHSDDTLGIYTVWAHVKTPDGREDEASGVVSVKGISGNALANLLMKAETKAKRRATLSIVGLGFLDESEVEGLGGVEIDTTTGEVPAPAQARTLLEQVRQQTETLAEAHVPTVVVDEPEPVEEEPEFTFQPMEPEVSAAIAVDDDDELEVISAEIEQPKGLTIQELAAAAKIGGLGKMAFAKALDVPAADLGKTIEAMTDAQRYQLGQSLGIVAP